MTDKKDVEVLSNGEEEEGLGVGVGLDEGNVVLIFSQKIATLGLPPAAARKMARALYDWADEADRRQKESFTQ